MKKKTATRKKRLSAREIKKQLDQILKLRQQGLSAAEACARVGMPFSTYYFRARRTGSLPNLPRRASKASVKSEKQIDGRTLAALLRGKTKQKEIALKIRQDLIALRRLQRQLLAAAKTLG